MDQVMQELLSKQWKRGVRNNLYCMIRRVFKLNLPFDWSNGHKVTFDWSTINVLEIAFKNQKNEIQSVQYFTDNVMNPCMESTFNFLRNGFSVNL